MWPRVKETPSSPAPTTCPFVSEGLLSPTEPVSSDILFKILVDAYGLK